MTQLSDEQLEEGASLLGSLTPAQLKRAYSGRQGCACGCRGKYYEQGTSPQHARQVTRILRLIQKALKTQPIEPDGDAQGLTYVPGSHFALDTAEGRSLVVYI